MEEVDESTNSRGAVNIVYGDIINGNIVAMGTS